MTLFQILFLVFLFIPIIEIYVLITVGGLIGAFPTIVLVVGTAILGAWLLRIQGFSTLQKVRASLAQGKIPAIEMLGGVFLLLAGALLLTPGFFTDTIGFLFLIPTCRHWLVLWFLHHSKFVAQPSQEKNPSGKNSTETQGRTIDGEFWKHNDR